MTPPAYASDENACEREISAQGRRKRADLASATKGKGFRRAAGVALGIAAALAATAVAVNLQSRRAERRHPPIGRFVTVNGVRLHYIEAGDGPPVVLFHGNGVSLDDMRISIFDRLAERHRVIAFDRPGFGYSERPRQVVWDPEAQAALFRDAFRTLGIERPVILGHSWGGPLVVTFALLYPEEVRAVVAASGYYYPNWRADSPLAWLNYLPVIGTVMRNTLTPVQGALMGKPGFRALFAPNEVPDRVMEDFPASLVLRPSQIRASSEDGATLRDWAKRISPHYGFIRVPVIIVAGADDPIVDAEGHSARLHADIPDSDLLMVPDTGHMVHHVHPEAVLHAIDRAFRSADRHSALGGVR
ncbi:MAG: alpha/beta hydrolase [Rhodospirillales bacterium]|nr:alpha/beta hydrolase [Rhodospirillales bacterium]